MNKELTFYRVRTRKAGNKENISDVEHMLHLPYNLRDKASSMRFSAAGLPGLYLGTNTYVCSEECRWNGSDELYASVFIPNSQGKKLKVLNLTISQALINGIYNRCSNEDEICEKLQNAMLKIFPLVIATSFSVESEEKMKYHYLLSQALMRVANRNGIDGIAYLSMKGTDEFQYPQGVNLAIPANDISDENLYSEKCKGFKVSKPVLYCGQEGEGAKSYINEIYTKYVPSGYESFTSKLDIDGEMKFYGETCYGKFDDYIVSHFLDGVK
ncbi:MAG: RES domain-containing protein [bacterium]|nr:RES domain-containing protein [bacterium]